MKMKKRETRIRNKKTKVIRERERYARTHTHLAKIHKMERETKKKKIGRRGRQQR